VIGHCFTPWLAFRGGKGVSCQLGASAALAWPWAAAAFGVAWLGAALLTRFVSVASLLASWAAVPAAALTGAGAPAVAALAVGAGVVTLRHRANLGRLRRGEEPRLGRGRAAPLDAGAGP
jgi:glycerol-3-phosphate acyltransferase PlsY